MQLQELLAEGTFAGTWEEFAFACEMLLVKSKSEQAVFHSVFNAWRKEIEEYILDQYATIGSLKETPDEQTRPIEQAPASGLAPDEIDNRIEEEEKEDILAPPLENPDSSTPEEPVTDGREQEDPDLKKSPDGEISFSISVQDPATSANGKSYDWKADAAALQSAKTFLFGNEFYPVGVRYLRQNWRSLKNRQQINEYAGADLQATIKKIALTGMFTNFERKKKTKNLISLYILLDCGGSMTAYEAFGKELVESAIHSGAHPSVTALHFYNLPSMVKKSRENYLFFNENQTSSWTTKKLFKNPNKKDTLALIYSDAGALRGTVGERRETRLEETSHFLNHLLKNTAYTVWLNPVPANRWKGTCAEDIARQFDEIPMFEATARGIEQAMHVLKGKPFINNRNSADARS